MLRKKPGCEPDAEKQNEFVIHLRYLMQHDKFLKDVTDDAHIQGLLQGTQDPFNEEISGI